jgi:formylglycine-generating enzyme required for sulfatase activity
MGPAHKTYGYADHSAPGKCNDHGRSPMQALYAGENLSHRDKWDWTRMNRPELNQLDGTLAHTGEHDECTNGYGVYDMVGNLHEWATTRTPRSTARGASTSPWPTRPATTTTRPASAAAPTSRPELSAPRPE